MSFENNDTISINKHGAWYTSYVILIAAIGFVSVIMLRISPSFSINVLNKSISGLINTDANDSYFAIPIISSFCKHLMIVSHWCLAWWTPGGPEINEPDFSLSVF